MNDNNPWGSGGNNNNPWGSGGSGDGPKQYEILKILLEKAKDRFGKFKIGGPRRNISIFNICCCFIMASYWFL